MSFKKIILKLHLVLGLTSGLVILFLGITGCILAFQKEIENATQSYRFVKAEVKPFLPPSYFKEAAVKELPDKSLHSIKYGDKSKAVQAIFYGSNPDHYYIIYFNPYNGQLLKTKNMKSDFFHQVIMGHFYLWLPPAIGQPIVASATLVFVILMISGLILWWPRNKAARKQRFTIKWSARWRRKNYDLHNVLGFYMTWVAIIIALTGLVWGFEWFKNTVYKVAGGEKSLVYSEPLSDTTVNSNLQQPVIDVVWNRMKQEHPAAQLMEVHIPTTKASAVEVAINPDASTYWKTDYRYFDQYTLKELNVQHMYGRAKDADAADKLIKMNYDIHTGAIWGIWGKMLMFFASLIAASLPVTGFYIWWGRRKKTNRKTPVSVKPVPVAGLSVEQ